MEIKRNTNKILLVLVVLCTILPGYIRAEDSLQAESYIRKRTRIEQYKMLITYALPAGLMAYGLSETLLAQRFKGLNYMFAREVREHNPRRFRVDDVMQYVPASSVYLLNMAGVKGRYNLKERTLILGIASVFTAASVNGLKYTVRMERPDKSARNSFPSGHAAVAFMGAEYLRQEYKEVSLCYGVGGYTIASATALLRVYNNKHWVGDIAFGAGLGILSTRLAYWLYPKLQKRSSIHSKQKKEKKLSDNLTLAPYYGGRQGGVSLVKQF